MSGGKGRIRARKSQTTSSLSVDLPAPHTRRMTFPSTSKKPRVTALRTEIYLECCNKSCIVRVEQCPEEELVVEEQEEEVGKENKDEVEGEERKGK